MDVKTFSEFCLLQRRMEYLKKKDTAAYKQNPEAIEDEYEDVNDVAITGLNEKTVGALQ